MTDFFNGLVEISNRLLNKYFIDIYDLMEIDIFYNLLQIIDKSNIWIVENGGAWNNMKKQIDGYLAKHGFELKLDLNQDLIIKNDIDSMVTLLCKIFSFLEVFWENEWRKVTKDLSSADQKIVNIVGKLAQDLLET